MLEYYVTSISYLLGWAGSWVFLSQGNGCFDAFYQGLGLDWPPVGFKWYRIFHATGAYLIMSDTLFHYKWVRVCLCREMSLKCMRFVRTRICAPRSIMPLRYRRMHDNTVRSYEAEQIASGMQRTFRAIMCVWITRAIKQMQSDSRE